MESEDQIFYFLIIDYFFLILPVLRFNVILYREQHETEHP